MRKFCLELVVVTVALCSFGERQPYERYQSVVDRQMFGPLPPGFDPTKSPAEVQKATSQQEKEMSKEQEKVKSSIRFSVINVTPEGETAIGFTDNSDPKAPVHYYLKVGESCNGWEVKEADPQAATMTISKDGIEVALSLGGDSAQNAAATQRAQPNSGRSLVSSGGGMFGGGSLRERRRMRQQRAQEEAAKQNEEAAKREEERKAADEEAKAQAAAEREEQRKQMLAIQEELKRAREAREADKQKTTNNGSTETEGQQE